QNLDKGSHKICVVSVKGDSKIEESFFLFHKKYIYIDFWYYPEDHYDPTPRDFTIEIKNKNMMLM
ncbi:MAG: hypothetical protein ABFS32_20950, partial [Bacteroidota bacterium]